MAFLIFEGADKVGKTTLLEAVNRATNYEHFCIDRSLGSAFVYDLITGRRNRLKKLAEIEDELSKLRSISVITVLLKCDEKVLVNRIKKEDEEFEERISLLKKTLNAYEEYKKITKLPFIEVDTSNKPVEKTVSEIVDKVQSYEKT